MTISLNAFSKTGLATTLFSQSLLFTSATLRVYPSTVTFPTSPVNGGAPAGNILTYSGLTYSRTGNTITITGGTTSANTTAAGTLAWFSITGGQTSYGTLVCDSVGLSGTGSILTVNTMTPSNAQSVTITLNLTLV